MTIMTLEIPSSPVTATGKTRLDFRRLHVIKDSAEYETVIVAIHALFDIGLKERTEEQNDLLEFLSVLAEAYEEANVEMPQDATPPEVVSFLLEQNGMSRVDLYDILGGKGRVSEFFTRKRELSKTQMIALKELFHIPLDLLVSEAAA